VLERAIAFARRVADAAAAAGARPEGRAPERRRLLPVRAQHGRAMAKNFPAPRKCVDAVERRSTKKFDDGMRSSASSSSR
jgi:hypothetical protein